MLNLFGLVTAALLLASFSARLLPGQSAFASAKNLGFEEGGRTLRRA